MSQLVGENWTTSPEKRLTDLALATGLLPVALPLSIGAAMAIRVIDGVDPIYARERPGLHEEPFTMYKLRTMPSETGEVRSTGGFNDPRASKLGKFLRKIRLDEVPQLYNIYRGDMSVVGPRPVVQSEHDEIMDSLSPVEQKEWRWARSVAKPGMIDAFGLHVYQEDYAVNTSVRVAADIKYAHEATFKGDLQVIGSCLGLFTTMFNRKGETVHEYRRGSKLLSMAAEAFGVEVSDEERQYWDTTFKLVRVLDNLVDDDKAEDLTPILSDIFESRHTDLVDDALAVEFVASTSHLPQDRKSKIFEALSSIADFATSKLKCKTPAELRNVSLDEARCFASIIELDERDDNPERIRFNEWLLNVAQASISLDAAVDLWTDAKNGNITIEPSARNALIIARGGLGHIRQAMTGLNIKTTKELVKAAAVCVVDR